MVRIFITGGTGFIGRHTVSKLCKRNECIVLTRQERKSAGNIKYVAGDIKNRSALKLLLEEYQCDMLLHLAWDVKSPSFATSNENNDWEKWSTALVADFLQLGGRLVISSGTCFEYGNNAKQKFTEKSTCHPVTPYGRAKLITYNKIKQMCLDNRARFVWGRVFYLYGPGEEERKLITNALNTLKRGGDFTCRNPENCIDYVHVEDAATAFAALIENEKAQGVFNICTGHAVRAGDMLRYIAKRLGAEDNLHLCQQESPLYAAGCNKKMLDAGVRMQYEDIYRGLDTYF